MDPTEPTEVETAEELYEDAPCGYLSATPDGTVVRVNGTLLRWTGYEREAVLGRTFTSLLSPGGRVYFETHLRPMLQTEGHVREIALEVVCADGARLPVLVNASTTVTRAGRDIVRITILDASERREYERELLRTRTDVEQLLRVTASMAASVDVGSVVDAVLDELAGTAPVDVCALGLLDRTGTRLELLGTRGTSAEDADPWSSEAMASGSAAAEAMSTGTARFLVPGQSTASLGAPDRMLALVPLVARDRSIGLLGVACSSSSRSADERRTLGAIAKLAGQAIDRARLADLARKNAERAGFLAEASREMEETQTVADRARRAVDLVVPYLADYATIEMPDRGPEPVAAAHREARLLQPLIDLRRRSRLTADTPNTVARAIATGQPQILSDIPEAVYEDYTSEPDQLELLRQLAPRSYVGLPLRARGHVVGALMLVCADRSRRFVPDDLPFLQTFADQVGLALENAQLYQSERTISSTLQRSMTAGVLPDDPRARLSVSYLPAPGEMQIGGDWYSSFMIGPANLAVVVGDVVGRGLGAAAAMGQLRSATRALAQTGMGVAAMFRDLERFVVEVEAAQVATLAYAELALDTGELRWACAGHPPPLLLTPDGTARFLWGGRSLPLGVQDEIEAIEREVGTETIPAGGIVVFYTDGVVERRGETIDEGLERLSERALNLTGGSFDSMAADLCAAMLADAPADDDLCLVCVSVEGAGSVSAVSPNALTATS
ncbi:MAG: SpoIIE family protein phosphatase [Actinomycetota bacterium]